ncbi:MAG: hypothetical protein RL572_1552 [Pseudomonadota bacterium]
MTRHHAQLIQRKFFERDPGKLQMTQMNRVEHAPQYSDTARAHVIP